MNPVPLFLIIVTLPLLLGGCGGTTEINSESQNVNVEELIERKEIVYLKGTYRGYTGKSYELHPNGQKEMEGKYKDGKQDGLWVWWYENGQKEMEVNNKDGKEDGLLVEWYENGQKSIEYNFEDGKQDGLETWWDENGQLRSEVNWEDGKKVSVKYWNSKGEPVDSEEEAEVE